MIPTPFCVLQVENYLYGHLYLEIKKKTLHPLELIELGYGK